MPGDIILRRDPEAWILEIEDQKASRLTLTWSKRSSISNAKSSHNLELYKNKTISFSYMCFSSGQKNNNTDMSTHKGDVPWGSLWILFQWAQPFLNSVRLKRRDRSVKSLSQENILEKMDDEGRGDKPAARAANLCIPRYTGHVSL